MSEENTVARGDLLCAIGNAGKHLWTLRGSDLFIYEHAFAAIRVTTRETIAGQRGRPDSSPKSWDRAHTRRLRAKGERSFEELSRQYASAKIVAATVIREGSLQSGWLFPRLTLSLTSRDILCWIWSSPPNPAFNEVEDALRQTLGPRLRVQ